jgi:CheY-like chemotaxis protein
MELKRATVLVVDDEPMLLDVFSEWLQEEKGCVDSRRRHGDVIVSDVRMPAMDGILLLKNLSTFGGLSKK